VSDAENLYSKDVKHTEEWQFAIDKDKATALGASFDADTQWLDEDDEHSASYAAVVLWESNKIRSRKVITTIEHYAYDGDDSTAERVTVEKTNWVEKTQTVVAR